MFSHILIELMRGRVCDVEDALLDVTTVGGHRLARPHMRRQLISLKTI